jgi:hypothetical protein
MSQRRATDFFSEKILKLKTKNDFFGFANRRMGPNFSKIFRMGAEERERLTSICQGFLRVAVILKGLGGGTPK